jgi:hypothetical protein
MAVERSQTFSPLDAPAPAPAMPMEGGETLSMSLLGGKEVKPGDVVRIVVQSVDDENGTWQGAYADDGDEEEMGVEETVGATFAPKGMM